MRHLQRNTFNWNTWTNDLHSVFQVHLNWQLCYSHIQNNSSILCTPGAFNFPLMWWHCTWLSCSFLPDPSLSTLMRWRGSFKRSSKNHLVIALWTWELCLGANVPGRKLASGEFSTFRRHINCHINWLKKSSNSSGKGKARLSPGVKLGRSAHW